MSTLQVNNITGLSVGGLPDGIITTDDIAAGAVTQSKRTEDLTLETAKSATGTSVDFTGIPSWVKKITVMFSGVSTSGSSHVLVQLGDSGGVENTGYTSGAAIIISTGELGITSTAAGFEIEAGTTTGSYVRNGSLSLANQNGNSWCLSGVIGYSAGGAGASYCGGSKTLSDPLDRIRITTVNGTDTFDAGSINIMYE